MTKKPIPATLSGSSADPMAEKMVRLQQEMPEIFTEGRIDAAKIKSMYGKEVATGSERYGLQWVGKANCYHAIQQRTTATLHPDRAASVDFDTTQNAFIEGDNLQVLKILQKSYYGRVKMIYIDPPYNTGNDFIYEDDFSRTRKEEAEAGGEVDTEGNAVRTDALRMNTKESGHYHSDWLNMIYPRLFLARGLLRDDGVIFVSIDDNEVANLRKVMDEIFGEENFEGHVHWRRRHNQPNDPTKLIALVTEHILVYSKNAEELKKSGVGKLELTGKFLNSDNDPRGDWNSKPWKVGSNQSGSKYKITTPTGKVLDEEWMGEEETFKKLLADNRIYFPSSGDGFPRKKIFKSERLEEGQCATNWFPHDLFGSNQDATNEFSELMDGNKKIFDNPKPTALLKNIIRLGNAKNDDLILDFFAGSGTTAHAVMQQNAEDGGNRRWVCVQLPEQCAEGSEAAKAGYSTIADIARERIRRAGAKIAAEHPDKSLDTGFRAFRAGKSNFKIWSSAIATPEELERQLSAFVDTVDTGATEESMLYELMLKAGQHDLTAPCEKRGHYYRIGDGSLLICLADTLDEAGFTAMLAEKPQKIVCLDRAFRDNDQLKTNLLLQARDAGVEVVVI